MTSFPSAGRRLTVTVRTGLSVLLAMVLLIGAGTAQQTAYADDVPVTEITLSTPATPEPDG
ncbi:MAG: hypothetical protein L0H26_10815 [Microlunatus sp.]|nr:hypothetical protein [Microlunatus sp.]